MNLRGEVLPIYDLKLRLRLRATPAAIAGPEATLSQLPRSARILVIRGGEAGDVGLLADRVTEVVRMRDSEIEPPPSGTADRECILGLGRTRDQLCILLDLDRAIA
jgi:purine-binding chemotaxis protein CheW